MDKIYLNPSAVALECEVSTRRIFNKVECRYLSWEARSMVYSLLDSQSISPDVTENAVQQAVALGSLSGEEIDVQTFEALFHAVSLNPSFQIPFWFVSAESSSDTWFC